MTVVVFSGAAVVFSELMSFFVTFLHAQFCWVLSAEESFEQHVGFSVNLKALKVQQQRLLLSIANMIVAAVTISYIRTIIELVPLKCKSCPDNILLLLVLRVLLDEFDYFGGDVNFGDFFDPL